MKEIRITMSSGQKARKGTWWLIFFSMISFFTTAGSIFLLFVRATGMHIGAVQIVWTALALTVVLRLVFLKPVISRVAFPAGMLLLAGFWWYRKDMLIQGFMQTADSVLARINKYYNTDFQMLSAEENEAAVTLFFQFAAVLLFFIIAFEIYHRMKIWLPAALAVLLVVGALAIDIRPEPISLFGCALGLFMGRAMEFQKGRGAFPNVQAKAGLLMGVAAAAAIAFSYFAAGPALHGLLLEKFDTVVQFQRDAENYMEQAVTDLASREGGFSFFKMMQPGGTMVSGRLSNTFGGSRDREAMRVTIDVSPSELDGMIYLRGFTGNQYMGDSWEAVDAEAFEEEASEWLFYAGDKSRAVANAPYRSAQDYQMAEGAAAQEVHYRIDVNSASDRYAYLPYLAEASDGLVFEGDGAILLESGAQREYSGYLETEETGSYQMRSQTEEQFMREHGGYVQKNYLDFPYNLQRLNQLSRELNGNGYISLDEATERIRGYLHENCRYSLDIDPLPQGEDFTEYFLFEQKEGFCTHFASTGLLLYRMMGFPARYVTGYVVRPECFHKRDGVYEFSVTGGNAHAWVEVYVDGFGWKPVEMTPGYESGSAEASQITEPEQETPQPQVTQEPTATATPTPETQETRQENSPAAEAESDVQEEKESFTLPPQLVRGLKTAGIFCLAAAVLWSGILVRRTVKRRRFLEKTGRRNRKRAAVCMARRCYEEWAYLKGSDKEFLNDGEFAEVFAEDYPELKECCGELMYAAQRAYFGDEEIPKEEYKKLQSDFAGMEKAMYHSCSRIKKAVWVYIKCFGR